MKNILKKSLLKKSDTCFKDFLSVPAITDADMFFLIISSAIFGPERTMIFFLNDLFRLRILHSWS